MNYADLSLIQLLEKMRDEKPGVIHGALVYEINRLSQEIEYFKTQDSFNKLRQDIRVGEVAKMLKVMKDLMERDKTEVNRINKRIQKTKEMLEKNGY